MQNLLEELKNLLATQPRFMQAGRMIKQAVIDAAQSLDIELLQLLMRHDAIKRHFFQDVNGIMVFDKVKLLRFVSNKAFLEDSYTAFKNKIGLVTKNSDGLYDAYLSDNKEVVLAYPYKDCMLEGGQTKEEQKRNEIFWNETLAPDDIDRLKEPKAFSNIKRYDTEGVHENVTDPSLNDNYIIKGNNLLALYSLLPVYRGKVKLIYIDPPYNTGNDSFRYNDSFNHSTWLTFMKDRLKVARELLKDDGVILVSLDDKEAHYCKILMDEIFKRENFIADICHKSRGSISNDKIISPNHNHILLFAKNERLVFANKAQFGVKKSLDGFKLKDEIGEYKLVPVDGPGGAVKGNPFYTFEGIEGYWRFSKEKMQDMFNKGLVVKTATGLQQKYYKEKAALSKQTVTTWWDENFLTSSATTELKKIMGEDVFKNPKNTNLLKRIVELWSDADDIILDYHSGSGTTAHAVLELNKEDKKDRKFILCEQMDYIDTVTCKRVLKVMENQGGGSFVYMELAQANQHFVAQIEAADTEGVLLEIWERMKAEAFISYKITPDMIDKNIKDYEALSFEDKKRFLIEILDKNLLYVPHCDMESKEFGLSEADKAATKVFYNLKNSENG